MSPKDKANKVYDIFVTHVGAPTEWFYRDNFVYHWGTPEYRISGLLGYGGKFWYKEFKVNCYSEDLTPGRQIIIDEVNRLLEEEKNG